MSKIPVMLSIRSSQNYEGQEPDVIELVTEGFLDHNKDVWEISYEESDLTGLEGVTTTFHLSKRGATLRRTGRLQSRMIFQEGVRHESLYQVEFGALMISVLTQKIRYDITEQGGTVDIVYGIEIEQSSIGKVDYHLEIKPIES